jgi:hypothetical protein
VDFLGNSWAVASPKSVFPPPQKGTGSSMKRRLAAAALAAITLFGTLACADGSPDPAPMANAVKSASASADPTASSTTVLGGAPQPSGSTRNGSSGGTSGGNPPQTGASTTPPAGSGPIPSRPPDGLGPICQQIGIQVHDLHVVLDAAMPVIEDPQAAEFDARRESIWQALATFANGVRWANDHLPSNATFQSAATTTEIEANKAAEQVRYAGTDVQAIKQAVATAQQKGEQPLRVLCNGMF